MTAPSGPVTVSGRAGEALEAARAAATAALGSGSASLKEVTAFAGRRTAVRDPDQRAAAVPAGRRGTRTGAVS